MQIKKRLTQHEEFEILKLVIDKFLWLGFGILAFGFYKLTVDSYTILWQGLTLMITGVIILGLLIYLIVREFEIVR